MYDNFFGFKERPFQLVPNPDYLFLSRSHEEAIAHLNYAIAHGDGFVEITGEVGTGKTTLCRVFLEDLDENTEVAYIFNPRLTSLELLRAINDEFAINATADNAKDLIDTLNTFLMEKKSQHKNAILLIDEAQNLSKDVLEQIRLLSNLETNTSKLLQIILVGQPELRQMLDSYELRQLGQRMTLSWYLTPLSRQETREYIRHRVNIAAKKTEDKFTWAAYYRIYSYSRGIPRLINIASDRALLTAFGFNRHKVTGSIAATAIRELRSRGNKTRIFTKGHLIIATLLLCVLTLLTILLFNGPRSEPISSKISSKTNRPINTPLSPAIPVVQFEDFLLQSTSRASRLSAIKTAISLWETTPILHSSLNNINKDTAFFQLAATQNNIQILTVINDWPLIDKLNLPAVLQFLSPRASAPCYLTLIQITKDHLVLKGGQTGPIFNLTMAQFKSYWTKTAYIPWKNFLNYNGDIPLDAPKESVFTLKMLLRDIGFTSLKMDNNYDNATRNAVKQIQFKYGITVDGIVGVKTKIAIYNEKKEFKIPLLRPVNVPPPITPPKPKEQRSVVN